MLNFITEAMSETSALCELDMKKSRVVAEAAYRELAINYGEAELKVINENGTSDDLQLYYEAANEGYLETIKKCLKKIKDAIAKFFSAIKSKIVSFISREENNDAIEKIEKKVKLVPFLKRKKVLLENYNEEAKLANETLSKLNKLKAKATAGQEVTPEEVDEVKQSFLEKHGKLIGVGAAVTVTVVVALSTVKAMQKESTKVTNKFEEISTKACEDCEKMIPKVKNPAVATKLADAVATVTKTTQEAYVRTWKSGITTIGQAVKTQGKTTITGKEVSKILDESTDDITKMSEKDIQNVMKSTSTASQIANANKSSEVSEDGENPMSDEPIDTVVDAPEDTSDVWDDVMATVDTDDTDGIDLGDDSVVVDDEDDVDVECGSNCGTECGTECGATESSEEDDSVIEDESMEESVDALWDATFNKALKFMEESSKAKNACADAINTDIMDFKSILSKDTDDNEWVKSAKKPTECEVVADAKKDVECPEVTQKKQYNESTSAYDELMREIKNL